MPWIDYKTAGERVYCPRCGWASSTLSFNRPSFFASFSLEGTSSTSFSMLYCHRWHNFPLCWFDSIVFCGSSSAIASFACVPRAGPPLPHEFNMIDYCWRFIRTDNSSYFTLQYHSFLWWSVYYPIGMIICVFSCGPYLLCVLVGVFSVLSALRLFLVNLIQIYLAVCFTPDFMLLFTACDLLFFSFNAFS